MGTVNSNFFSCQRTMFRRCLSSARLMSTVSSHVFVRTGSFLFICSILTSLRVAAGPSKSEVRVLHSDEQSIVFEFRPSFLPPEKIQRAGQEFLQYDFEGSAGHMTEERPGAPDLRHFVVTLGLPAESGTIIRTIASDYEDVPGVVLSPVPTFGVRDGILEASSYLMDPESYAEGSFLPSAAVSLTRVAQMRSMYIGSVSLSPLQYNPASRTLRKYSRIVVEVIFGAPARNRARNNDHLLVKGVVLNYDVARNWTFAREQVVSKTAVSSVLSRGFWYKIPVKREGMYILDAAYLQSAGVDVDNIDPRTLRIYGNGGSELSEVVADPRPTDLVENAVYVQGESDGLFNDGDFLIFYARPVRRWVYNPTTKLFDPRIHHYSDVNYYWLTYGGDTGKRMQQIPSASEPTTVVADRFTGLVLVDEDTINLLSSGKDWYGPAFNANSSIVYTNPVPGVIAGSTITYRYSLIARSLDATPTIIVKEGATVIAQVVLSSVTSGSTIATEKTSTTKSTVTPLNSTSQLTFTLNSSSFSASAWLNRLEIQYPRNFSATGNYLRFRSPDTTGIIEYRLTGFTAAPFILDVTDPLDPKIVTGATGSYTFKAPAVAGIVSEFCAGAGGSYVVPEAMQFVTNQDIRGIVDGYDFIIVTSKEIRSAADRLAAFREQPLFGDLRTLVLDVDQIYNEFSGGVPDVTAIRDMLKNAYDTWTRRPMFGLFFGQGSYDYKSRLGFTSSTVPTWQSLDSRNDLTSYASDDFFVKFGTSATPSMVTGRLNPRTIAEADQLVTKLMGYEENSARDPWKMRILFVGDDSETSEGGDGSLHSAQAEILAESDTPAEFEKRKIYIAEYPTVITAQGRRKPGAYDAIIDEINRGVLIVNFTGHGNPTVWTHESVFTVQTSIPLLVNANRLAVFFLATCNFSQFDDANRYTGAELLLNKSDGGGIGVVSATRKVYALENFLLNRDIYEHMFITDQYGRVVVERPATALFQAKLESNSVNDQKFFFMGDPSMMLQYPRGYAIIDTINTQPVDSVNGAPRADSDPIQIRALQKVTIKGSMRNTVNQPDTSFDGTMSLVVNDATRRVSIAGFPPGVPTPFSYAATGGTIYRGENSVGGGKFGAAFIVPKDILYADSTTRGRVVAYITDGQTDAAGYTGRVFVGGTDTSAIPDENGPSISIYLDTRNFRAGDHVSDDPMLIVDLADSSGINTSVSGIGHRIEIWTNGATQSVDITDQYTSALDDFRSGTIQYQMRDLPYGRNSIRLRAWDAFNNASTVETFFEVTSGDQLSINDVFNYPNPFSRETSFTFRQNQLVPLNIQIKIYTLAGRLIQSLDAASPGEPFIQVPWDGRDRDGDILANGVYLYKIVVSTVDGRFASEALGKLSVLK